MAREAELLSPSPRILSGVLALLASFAIALPTLIAFNIAPSATFFNQAAAFVGWGGFLLALAGAMPKRGVAACAGHARDAGRAGHRLSGGVGRVGIRPGPVVPIAIGGGNRAERHPRPGRRRSGAARRFRRTCVPRLLRRTGRRWNRQQPDRPGAGIRPRLARRRLGRDLGDPGPCHRQCAPAKSPQQPVAVVDRRGRLARRNETCLSKARHRAGARIHLCDRAQRLAHRRGGNADPCGVGLLRSPLVAARSRPARALAADLRRMLVGNDAMGHPEPSSLRRPDALRRQRRHLQLALWHLVEHAVADRDASMAGRWLRRVQFRLVVDAVSRPAGGVLRSHPQHPAQLPGRARHSARGARDEPDVVCALASAAERDCRREAPAGRRIAGHHRAGITGLHSARGVRRRHHGGGAQHA